MKKALLAPLALVLSGALAGAQGVGSQLPAVELDGLSQTSASSYDDLVGRAVLLEFFAYW